MDSEYLLPALGAAGVVFLYLLITRGFSGAKMGMLMLAAAGAVGFVVYLGYSG